MDVDDQLRNLLVRAADLPDLAEPPIAGLVARGRRRRRRHWAALAGAVSACVTVAVVVSLTVSVHHRGRADSTLTGPAPTPSVSTPEISPAELATGHWSALPPAPIAGRTESAVAWTGEQMIIWGGTAQSAGKSVLLDDGAAYSPSSNSWLRLPVAPLSPRTDVASVWTGSKLFVWGGLDDLAGARTWSHDGAVYDPASRQWRLLPAAPTSAYGSTQAVWTGRRVVLITASSSSAARLHASAYDPAANQWSRLPDLVLAADQPGGQFVALAGGAQVYVWSEWADTKQISPNEYTGGSGIAGYTLDSGGRAWTPNRLAPSARGVNGAQWTGHAVIFPAQQPWRSYLMQGPRQMNLTSTEVDPASGAVTVIPHGPVDDLRARYVWTGTAWLAYDSGTYTGGGGTTVHYPGEIALWNPATNAWVQLPSAPLAGDDIAEVWTGTALLFWGQLYPPKSANSGQVVAPQTAGLRFGR